MRLGERHFLQAGSIAVLDLHGVAGACILLPNKNEAFSLSKFRWKTIVCQCRLWSNIRAERKLNSECGFVLLLCGCLNLDDAIPGGAADAAPGSVTTDGTWWFEPTSSMLKLFGAENAFFCAIFYSNPNIFQDGLGTNIGKHSKDDSFS